MLPKTSLLKELTKGGYEASLITTYNAYLPFYEEVVLRRLVNAGVRHNVLMMDARQYTVSVEHHPPRLAGRQYTLLPMKVGGAFHPKLVFLAGKHKGLVLVGSHNMTISGFGFNRELTNLVKIEGKDDAAGIAFARDVWSEIDVWLEAFANGVPWHLKDMVRRVRDFAPWLNGQAVANPDLRLLAGRPGGPSLWEQFTEMLTGVASQVSLCGPFFDNGLRFIDRVREDLAPAALAVAIDPKTVQIPAAVRTLSGVSLVQAAHLGADNEEESSRYLHAKGILVEHKGGSVVLAAGSANPSEPAWLAAASSGNVELMLARRDEGARAAADALGFSDIPQMAPMQAEDWQVIAANTREIVEPAPPLFGRGIACVEEDRIVFDGALLEGLGKPEFTLFVDGRHLFPETELHCEGGLAVVGFGSAEIAQASELHVMENGGIVLKLLLHHVRAIEEQVRTGTQRQFKDALLSLQTDTPNIALLIQCIDKIVFAEHPKDPASALKRAGTRSEAQPAERSDPDTLAIDVADIKRRKTKHRLSHSGDFAYLLDALIYHLRIHEDKSVVEVDRLGRNEEEQVGADDDQDADPVKETAQKQEDLLKVCHSKVKTVVNRMAAQLEAYMNSERSLDDVLVRLLGVLAVLRELRSCDGRVAWVDKGRTTVPEPQRLRLLQAVMFSLFEHNSNGSMASLLHLDVLGEDFRDSDDVARLKGLVLWLAWDCGLALDLKKPFMESREHLAERLRRNAMVLALAQMIRADDVVIDEARQSIGSLTASELTWLMEIQLLADQCASLRADLTELYPAQMAQPGDIAVHRTSATWDLRVVASGDDNRLFVVRLTKEGTPMAFLPEALAVARLTELKASPAGGVNVIADN
ncbi:MAG: hypothetical protein JJU27_15960 [Gammaproteobacteria bacterium]|nr:hypothetical protein [Gammaproteobacteria bacterium]